MSSNPKTEYHRGEEPNKPNFKPTITTITFPRCPLLMNLYSECNNLIQQQNADKYQVSTSWQHKRIPEVNLSHLSSTMRT